MQWTLSAEEKEVMHSHMWVLLNFCDDLDEQWPSTARKPGILCALCFT
jgi:hypothetical protein